MVGALVATTFAVTGAYFLIRVVFAFSWIDRVNNITHVSMAVTMVLMAWPTRFSIPVVVQIVVFSAATLWYVYLLTARPRVDPGLLLGHHESLVALLWYHAFMMASMVWAALAMSALVSSAPRGPGMSDMPRMAMGTDSGITLTAAQATLISMVLGLVYVAATVWLLVLFFVSARSARGRFGVAAPLDAVSGVAMAAGMALSFLFLIA